MSPQTKLIEIALTPEDIRNLGYESKRGSDLPQTFRLQMDGTWKTYSPTDDQDLTIKRPLVVGTLGGRHTGMQADIYLAGKVEPGQAAFDEVYAHMVKICQYAPAVEVHLIYSGLTECTLAAVMALIAYKMQFKILRFDHRVKGYIPLDLYQFNADLSR